MGQPTRQFQVSTSWPTDHEGWVNDVANSRVFGRWLADGVAFMFDHIGQQLMLTILPPNHLTAKIMQFGCPSNLATNHCILYIIQSLPLYWSEWPNTKMINITFQLNNTHHILKMTGTQVVDNIVKGDINLRLALPNCNKCIKISMCP